jgi:hypothetical protein
VIDAKDIIDDAIDALSSGRSEARFRAVAGRAYYAAYHFLLTHPCGQTFAAATTSKKGGLHRDFITWLYKSTDSCVLSVAMKLDALFDNRVIADYKLNEAFSAKVAQDSIDDASDIIDIDLRSYNAAADRRTYP